MQVLRVGNVKVQQESREKTGMNTIILIAFAYASECSTMRTFAFCIQLFRLEKGSSLIYIIPSSYMPLRNEQDHGYTQPSLDGLASIEQEEERLENCLVLDQTQYINSGKHQEWKATVHAEPSIFQPDIDAVYLVSASNDLARLARRRSFKPGDRIALTGVTREDKITLPSGETRSIHRIALTAVPDMVVKEKRVSTTVFDVKRKK